MALAATFLVFIIWFGATFHPIEEVNSGEWDNYVEQVDRIRRGQLPSDTYRPALYPLVSAALGELLGDSFSGARLTSSLFAALFVLSAFLIGRELRSSALGLFAAAAMALNHNVIRFGVHATTDMTFAALAGMTLFAALRVMNNPRWMKIALLSFLFAMAYFARYTAVGLLPCVILALLVGGRKAPRRIASNTVLFALCALLFLVPHFVLTYMSFGNPFYNDNWRNLAFKLHGNWDWTYLSNNPFNGTWSVIAHDPFAFVASGVRESVKFIFLTMGHLGGYGLAGGIFASATLAAVYSALTTLNSRRLVLLTYLAGYVLAICMFFYTSRRLMLPILPISYVLAGEWLIGSAFRGHFAVGTFRVANVVPVFVVFLIITASATARELPGFMASHPTEELRAVEGLEHQYGDSIVVLGTAPYFQRHVGYEYRVLKLPEQPSNMAPFIDQLSKLTVGVDFVVIGRLTGRGIPSEIVDATAPPSFLELVRIDRWATIYRVRS